MHTKVKLLRQSLSLILTFSWYKVNPSRNAYQGAWYCIRLLVFKRQKFSTCHARAMNEKKQALLFLDFLRVDPSDQPLCILMPSLNQPAELAYTGSHTACPAHWKLTIEIGLPQLYESNAHGIMSWSFAFPWGCEFANYLSLLEHAFNVIGSNIRFQAICPQASFYWCCLEPIQSCQTIEYSTCCDTDTEIRIHLPGVTGSLGSATVPQTLTGSWNYHQ